MNQIQKKTLEGELKYKDTIILTYKIEYPVIISSPYVYGQEIFNMYNKNKAYQLESYCKGELYKQARDLYVYNTEHGYPVMQFQVILETNITLNQEGIVSVYQDQYTYTGGAHGTTLRSAQTWTLPLGKRMTLKEFYPQDPDYVLEILREITTQIQEQIQAGTGSYFDDYCQLVLDTFQLQNFYVIPDKTVLFFQQYDIAPYSSGIPTFEVNR